MVQCGVLTKAGKPCKLPAPCMVHKTKGGGKKKIMPNTCWKGYQAYGTKMKKGKEVPNCVPIKKGGKVKKTLTPEERKEMQQEERREEEMKSITVDEARQFLGEVYHSLLDSYANAVDGLREAGIGNTDIREFMTFLAGDTNVIPDIFYTLYRQAREQSNVQGGMNGKDEAKDSPPAKVIRLKPDLTEEEDLPKPIQLTPAMLGMKDEAKEMMIKSLDEKISEIDSLIADRQETLDKIKAESKSKFKMDLLSAPDDFDIMTVLGKDIGKSMVIGGIKGELAELKKSKKELLMIKDNILKAIGGAGLVSAIKKAGKFIARRILPIVQFGPRGNRPTGRFKDYLKKDGDKKIVSVDYGRVPLSAGVKTAMNILSTGKFSKKQKELGYEDIYHDFIIVTYADGSKQLLEKNHVIENKPITDEAIKNIKVSIPVKRDLTLNQMITNASYEDNEFYKYSANKKNCQDFARRIIDKNSLLPQVDTYKILEKQKADELVNTIPAPLKGIPLIATNLANALDRVVYGDGIKGGANPNPKKKYGKAVRTRGYVSVSQARSVLRDVYRQLWEAANRNPKRVFDNTEFTPQQQVDWLNFISNQTDVIPEAYYIVTNVEDEIAMAGEESDSDIEGSGMKPNKVIVYGDGKNDSQDLLKARLMINQII